LRFWYRFVEPNRSRLAAQAIDAVQRDVQRDFPIHLGGIWEALARASVPHLKIAGRTWNPAARWWGRDENGGQLELDLVAEAAGDAGTVLVGEAKLAASRGQAARLLADLERRAGSCPALRGRRIVPALWLLRPPTGRVAGTVITANRLMRGV
jgi:hypothetical protein